MDSSGEGLCIDLCHFPAKLRARSATILVISTAFVVFTYIFRSLIVNRRPLKICLAKHYNFVIISHTCRLIPAEVKPPRLMKWIGRSPLWSGLRLPFSLSCRRDDRNPLSSRENRDSALMSLPYCGWCTRRPITRRVSLCDVNRKFLLKWRDGLRVASLRNTRECDELMPLFHGRTPIQTVTALLANQVCLVCARALVVQP